MTELLLSAGADPNVGVKPDGLHKYVVGCAGRAYVDMMMMMLERLKKEAYPPSGKVRDVARSSLCIAALIPSADTRQCFVTPLSL
jgi:hypothetical protein